MRHHPDALRALAERYRKFSVVPLMLGGSQHRQRLARGRQAVFALTAAFFGAAVLSVVGAYASEPRVPASNNAFGQSMEPPPLLLRPLAKSAAIALNESIAFSRDLHQAAPFKFTGDASARERAVECLTTAIYYEAASEGAIGEEAVAQVVLNRVRSPSFPSSICAVVYQGSLLRTGCQFSFTCDGSLQRAVLKPDWLQARQIAESALAGAVRPEVGLSTHYHTIDVVPYWATSLAKQVQVGRHIFYRWPGSWGRPGAFRQKYAGNETDPFMLRDTALVAKGIWPSRSEGMSGPEIEVSSDTKLEAEAIVSLLSREPASEPSAFEAAARAHFQPAATVASDKLAFEGDENDPAAATEDAAVEDLATSSRMREFLRAHRRDYKLAAAQAKEGLQRLAAVWQVYTGSTISPQRVKLLLSNSLIEPRCKAAPMGALARHAIAVQPSDYQLFIASGLPNALVARRQGPKSQDDRALAKLVETVRTDLVFAVFSRVAALSGGPKEQALVLRAAAQGRPLVPVIAKRLERFESNRMQYPTLSEFLPELLKGLPVESPSEAVAGDDATSNCGWPAPVSIASADSRPAPIIASQDPRP